MTGKSKQNTGMTKTELKSRVQAACDSLKRAGGVIGTVRIHPDGMVEALDKSIHSDDDSDNLDQWIE